jgi:hypothetical protein
MVPFDSMRITSVVPLILSTTVPLFSLAMPVESRLPEFYTPQATLNMIRRQNGNPNVAGDIYGLGLRVGAYLQIFGMLLSCIRTQKRSRAGILLLSSSVCLSLFLAWTILVVRRSISPCEAWLILSLSAAYGVPRFSAMNETESSKGGVAIICCLVSCLWQEILYFWFFATLYRELPFLGTPNVVWFFAPVDLGGWFRILMLVVTCFQSLLLPYAIGPYLNMALERFVDWTGADDSAGCDLRSENLWTRLLVKAGHGAKAIRANKFFVAFVHFGDNVLSRGKWKPVSELTDPELQVEAERMSRVVRKWRIGLSVWGFVILVLTIVGVEKIIVYNDLYPTSDLSQPGQNIPFILGIITLLVGASHALKPTPVKKPTPPTKAEKRQFRKYTLHELLDYPEAHFPEDSDQISEIDVTDESEKKEVQSEGSLRLSGMERGILSKALIKDMV